MLNATGQLVLIDWSAARAYNDHVVLPGQPSFGSIITASDKVLDNLLVTSCRGDSSYTVMPVDEGASLLLMAATILKEGFGKISVADITRVRRHRVYQNFKPLLATLAELEKVAPLDLSEIDRIVRKGLVAMTTPTPMGSLMNIR
jgi:hypothetical protein